MPVFNGQPYIMDAIQSILLQTYANFELIILDDGSTDGTLETVCSINDPRIRLIVNKKRLGLIESLNHGIELAQGEFIARMDADDLSEPTRFAEQVAVLDARHDLVLIGSDTIFINRNGEIVGRPTIFLGSCEELYHNLPFANFINHPTVLIRTAALRQLGGYSQEYKHAEDYGLWLHLLKTGKIANLNKALLRYRVHQNNTSLIQQCALQRSAVSAAKDYWHDARGISLSHLQQELQFLMFPSASNLVSIQNLQELIREMSKADDSSLGLSMAVVKLIIKSLKFNAILAVEVTLRNLGLLCHPLRLIFIARIFVGSALRRSSSMLEENCHDRS